MKKKFLSALLALSLLISGATALISCGGNDDTGSSKPQSSESSNPSFDDETIFGTKESEGLAYTLSKDETHYLVSGLGECKDTKVVIPATYNNRPVLGISEGNSQLGAGAFEGCPTIESIVLPEGATTIGAAAFASCRNLVRVSIPDSITFIQETAFNGCAALVYNEYENGKYLGNKNNPYAVLMKAKDTAITSCSVNKKTVMIGTKAFSKCSALTSVTFENVENWSVDGTAILKTELENKSTAASYLTSANVGKIWLRAN